MSKKNLSVRHRMYNFVPRFSLGFSHRLNYYKLQMQYTIVFRIYLESESSITLDSSLTIGAFSDVQSVRVES